MQNKKLRKIKLHSHGVHFEYDYVMHIEFSTGLKITTAIFKPEPDAVRHTSVNGLSKPDPPRTCIVFLIHLLS